MQGVAAHQKVMSPSVVQIMCNTFPPVMQDVGMSPEILMKQRQEFLSANISLKSLFSMFISLVFYIFLECFCSDCILTSTFCAWHNMARTTKFIILFIFKQMDLKLIYQKKKVKVCYFFQIFSNCLCVTKPPDWTPKTDEVTEGMCDLTCNLKGVFYPFLFLLIFATISISVPAQNITLR